LAKLLTSSKAKAVVTSPQLLETVMATMDKVSGGGCPVLLVGDEKKPGTISLQELMEKRVQGRLEKPAPEALLALPFSSGTTGPPKGVVISHRNMVANICATNHQSAVPSFENGKNLSCLIA